VTPAKTEDVVTKGGRILRAFDFRTSAEVLRESFVGENLGEVDGLREEESITGSATEEESFSEENPVEFPIMNTSTNPALMAEYRTSGS